MRDVRIELANELFFGNTSLHPDRWLTEELNDLALRISGLDEIPVTALIVLARLSAFGTSDERALSTATGMSADTVLERLEALEEFGFVTAKDNSYEATARGDEAFIAIGRKMVVRKRFEMKRQYDHLDQLYQNLSQP